MKNIFIALIILIFSIASCSDSKKSKDDYDSLIDDDVTESDIEQLDGDFEDLDQKYTDDEISDTGSDNDYVDDENIDEETDEYDMDDDIDEEVDGEVDEDNTDDDPVVPENVIFVKHDAIGLNDGSSWENAYTDLSEAMNFLIENNIEDKDVWVAKGTYYPTDCPNLYESCEPRERHFTMKANVAVYGGFDGTETEINQRDYENNTTILSGDFDNNDSWDEIEQEWSGREENAYHVFYHDGWFFHGTTLDENAILDGFIIKGGNADGVDWPHEEGGGIRNNTDKSNPLIRNCVFYENMAKNAGGAIYNHEGASPVIENGTFVDNIATVGGAIHNYQGSPVIKDSTFTGNMAFTAGGGIGADDSDITIENCIFGDNVSENTGGGLFLKGTETPEVRGCHFNGNSAVTGGAMTSHEAENVLVRDCYFINNEAVGDSLPEGLGGAVYNDEDSGVVILNSVFDTNSAIAGGAIFNLMSSPSIINCSVSNSSGSGAVANGGSNPEIVNTIIYGNSSGGIFNVPEGTYSLPESTPVIGHSNVEGCGGSSDWIADCGTDSGFNIDADPLFSGAEPDPLLITTGSPCIDTGDSSKVPEDMVKDIAGNDRVQGLSVDMGAYEFE